MAGTPTTSVAPAAAVVASLEKDYAQKMRDFEGNSREQIDGAHRNAKGLIVELEQKMGSAVPGLISNIEKAIVARVYKMETFFEARK